MCTHASVIRLLCLSVYIVFNIAVDIKACYGLVTYSYVSAVITFVIISARTCMHMHIYSKYLLIRNICH